jgi:hypothetical protein
MRSSGASWRNSTQSRRVLGLGISLTHRIKQHRFAKLKVMSSRGFGPLVITLIVVAALIAGGFWYYETQQSGSGSNVLTVQSSSTPSANSTTTVTISSGVASPQTTRISRASTSPVATLTLHQIVIIHQEDASRLSSNPQLFEARTSLTASQINSGNAFLSYAFTSFLIPQNNINYVEVDEWFSTSTSKRNVSVNSAGFVMARCAGGPAPQGPCGSPTAQPEDASDHLPIQNWNIDIADIIRILKANNYNSSDPPDIIVTTVGRARNEDYTFWPQASSALNSLPDGQSVILVIGTRDWMILAANAGKVLGSGTYSPLPPPV